MEVDKILICRLCFEICKTNFEVITDATKHFINSLLNVDLNISDEPLICNICVDNLKDCFNFKVNYHKRRETSIKHEDAGVIVPSVSENTSSAPEICTSNAICCSCMGPVSCDASMLSKNEERNLSTILEKYFPELISNNSVGSMCMACYNSLQNPLNFISNCLAAEQKIMEYCKSEGTNSKRQVELSNVLHFIAKNKSQNNICNSFIAVKLEEEKFCEEPEAEDNTEVKNEELIDVEEPGICYMEKEDIDMKMEYDGYRFDAFQIRHQKHLELHSTEVTTYNCELCTFETKNEKSLQRHMITHKPGQKNASGVKVRTLCEIGTYQSQKKDKRSNHMLIQKDPSEVVTTNKRRSEVTMYECEVCTYQSRNKQALSHHMRSHKDPSGIIMHKCEICTYRGRRKCDLSKHMLSHKDPSEIIVYKCEICPYHSKRKGDISKHMLAHKRPSDVTMFKC